SVHSLHLSGAGHHDQLASNDLVEFDGARKALQLEGLGIVMGREATDTQVVHEFSDILSLIVGPAEVRRIELDNFVSDFGNRADGARQVLFEFLANRVEFQTHRNTLALSRSGNDGSRCRYGKKRTSRNGTA